MTAEDHQAAEIGTVHLAREPLPQAAEAVGTADADELEEAKAARRPMTLAPAAAPSTL